MSDPSKPPPLDYRSPQKASHGQYLEDADDRRWRMYRRLYRLGLFVLLGPVIFFFVHNFVFFGKLMPLTPADFVPRAQSYIPVIIALKEYERDNGQLPDKIEDLQPKYLPTNAWYSGFIDKAGNTCATMGGYHPSQVISYCFTPGHEGWTVFGLFANGAIPLPPVSIPATQAATQP